MTLWIDDWLSVGRFGTYLTATGGVRERGLNLYEWNARLSAAFLHDMNHLEVALRNAYDRALTAAIIPGENHRTEPQTIARLFPGSGGNDQLLEQQKDNGAISRAQIEKAREEASKPNNSTLVPGKVIAELMFGFWTYLTSNSNEKTIWVPYLHKAFPPGTERRKVHYALFELRNFRNRVAHHEPILTKSELERRRMMYVVRLLSPNVLNHLTTNSEVSAILTTRP